MNGKHAIQNILATSSTVNALIGGSEAAARIYYNVASQRAAMPHIILKKQGTEPNGTKSGASKMDFDTVQVIMQAATETETQTLAAAVRAALDRVAAGTYNTVPVLSIDFIDDDDLNDEIDNKIIYSVEHIYKVILTRTP